MKESIIHFDGADKTGKDTVRDLIVKESQGKYLIYVRSYISQIVYSRLNNRNIDEYFFWKRMKEDSDRGDMFFVFKCDMKVVAERFIKHNEQDLHIAEYDHHSNIFDDVVQEARRHGISIMDIDTTHDTIEQTVNKIKNRLKLNET